MRTVSAMLQDASASTRDADLDETLMGASVWCVIDPVPVLTECSWCACFRCLDCKESVLACHAERCRWEVARGPHVCWGQRGA